MDLCRVAAGDNPGSGGLGTAGRTAVSLDVLRAYVVGLGGHLDIVARTGNVQLDVA